MVQLRYSNYGFECDYVSKGEEEQVIEKFRKHMLDEHWVDYSKETLMQFISRDEEYP